MKWSSVVILDNLDTNISYMDMSFESGKVAILNAASFSEIKVKTSLFATIYPHNDVELLYRQSIGKYKAIATIDKSIGQ